MTNAQPKPKYVTRLLPKQLLRDIIWGDEDGQISIEITGTRRWSTDHEMIFSYEGKTYSTTYSKGATESQDEGPYEWEPDAIEVTEVQAVSRTVTVYEPITVEG